MDNLLTPIYRFPADSPFRNIIIKREDFSETGSHKFRYLKTQLEKLKGQGIDRVVLSTTGNVGITASHYGKILGIKVFCLMSDKGDMDRAAQIEKEGGLLVISSRPKRFSEYISKKYKVPLLRGSREDAALEDYKKLGEELMLQAPETKALVMYSTSGTSAIGLMKAYDENKMPALHIVCEQGHPIVRADELDEVVKKSGGQYWNISPGELLEAHKILQANGLDTSWEGQRAFAAAMKIKDSYESMLVLFSGKNWPASDFIPSRKAETFEEVDRLWSQF